MELGVDLGTSSTVAFLRRDGNPPEPVLFDGAPLLPSAVYAEDSGALLVGRDAVYAARARPERFEGNPKRRIDDGTVLLGAEVSVETLLGALLRRVVTEAERIGGTAITGATICHPAAWGPSRRATLLRAAAGAGLPAAVRLVPEPVAAAAFHLRRHGPGPADLLVYDLGAGTFDVAVVRHAPDPGGGPGRMEVLCSAGLDETGGQDVDAAIVDLLRRRSGEPELWARLDNPVTVADRAARRQLWDDVRNTKEMLSRTSSALLYLPLLHTDQMVTREELEALAAPLIRRTVAAVVAALAECQVPLRPLGAVILVGGASRMPLVATMLHQALGIPPTIIDQPELVVAAGSIDPLVTGLPAAGSSTADASAGVLPSPGRQQQPASPSPQQWPAGPGQQQWAPPQPVLPQQQWNQPQSAPPQQWGQPPQSGPPQRQWGQPQSGPPQQQWVPQPVQQQPVQQWVPQQPWQAPQGGPGQQPPLPQSQQPWEQAQVAFVHPPQPPQVQVRAVPVHPAQQQWPQQPAVAVQPQQSPGWQEPAADRAALINVEVLEFATPQRQGVILRGQLDGGFGIVEHVFAADADSRLLVFDDTMALARYAARDASDRLVATPPWQVLNDGADARRFDLEVLIEHLSGPPQGWLPGFVCRCRDLCAQLTVYLDLDGADDLLGEHSTIDQADDILRRHLGDAVPGRGALRRLARLDRAQLVEDWTDLVALIDERSVTAA